MPHHDPITLDDIDALLEKRTGPCLSIFLPTARVTRDTDQDRIQLKNFRAEAFDRLMTEHGLRRPDAEALLLPVDEMLEDESFWPYLSDGLAIFLAPDAHFAFRVAEPFAARLALGQRFVLKPLLPLLSGGGAYYVLAISRNEVRLFEGSRQGASEIQIDEIPKNMAEALRMRGREAERAPNKQWQGDEGQKALYRKYFLQIDRVLRPLYGSRSEPLVIAGVDYLLPIFREATGYRHLLPVGIPGNPERLSPAEIHAKAWPLVEPLLDAPRREALQRLKSLRGTDRVTDDVSTILGAAFDGRVQTLFLDVETDVYGSFDPQTRETVVHGTEAEAPDIDLGGLAGRWVYARGGEVYAAAQAEIPDARPLTAIMRY
jgi:hypothetical protein